MDATELREKLAALAEFGVIEYSEPNGIRIVRSASAQRQASTPESEAPRVDVVLRRYGDGAALHAADPFVQNITRNGELDELEAALGQVGA